MNIESQSNFNFTVRMIESWSHIKGHLHRDRYEQRVVCIRCNKKPVSWWKRDWYNMYKWKQLKAWIYTFCHRKRKSLTDWKKGNQQMWYHSWLHECCMIHKTHIYDIANGTAMCLSSHSHCTICPGFQFIIRTLLAPYFTYCPKQSNTPF